MRTARLVYLNIASSRFSTQFFNHSRWIGYHAYIERALIPLQLTPVRPFSARALESRRDLTVTEIPRREKWRTADGSVRTRRTIRSDKN